METKSKYAIKWVETPGHGYLRCPIQAICDAGVAHLVTPYSFVGNGDTFLNQKGYAYLEEDCDAGMVLFALGLADVDAEFDNEPSDEREPEPEPILFYGPDWREDLARFRYNELKRFGFVDKPLPQESKDELLENFSHLRK